jgi:hypothetical protein
MVGKPSQSDRITGLVRWIARILGTAAAVFWVLALTASAIGEASQGLFKFTLVGLVLGSLNLMAAIGAVLAWKTERTGGIILTLAGIGLFIFALVEADFNKLFAALISGAPFLVAGILYLVAWRRSTEASGSP